MLAFSKISHHYAGVPVLREIDLQLEQGEILCLLGASGSGKTTLLRIAAGLEQPQKGEVLWDGSPITRIPVHQRGFGLMFQDFALFPHMNVHENVRFGLRMSNISRREQETRIDDVLSLVGMKAFARRDVTSLSGGEKQRVALARSLAPRPRLLMLDEPLGSLDAALREHLVIDLANVIRKLDLTALYVTHDQREAFAVADRVAILNSGKVEMIASPHKMYRHPTSIYVARFLGFTNVLSSNDYANVRNTTHAPRFPGNPNGRKMLIHPAGIHLCASGTPGALSATVKQAQFTGELFRVTATTTAGIDLTFSVPMQHGSVHVGDNVCLAIDPDYVLPLSG